MSTFKTMLKVESKITIRSLDSIFFGVFFPVGIVLLLGIIYGNKPAFEGANYTFMQQSFGALITIGICATGLMGIPLVVSDNRDKKILKRFQVTPISPAVLLTVQIFISFIISIVSSAAVYGISAIFFGYRFIGNLGGFLLSYLLVTIAIYSLGMLLASISPNLKVANLLCTLIYFPMLFLSGATVPYEIMPSAMQNVVDVLPLTQGIKLLKGFSLGNDVGSLIFPICLMLGIAIICTVLSLKLFKWEYNS